MSTPWWYSGESELGSEDDANSDQGTAHEGGRDWTTLLTGAQRMITWATEQMVAPHAEHENPREHPQCLLCRGSLLVGDSRIPGFAGKGDDVPGSWEFMAAESPVHSADPVEWIPFVDE